MAQTNVSSGGTDTTRTVDRSGTGMGMGMIMALLVGILLLAAVAWWAVAQSGWFGPVAPSTNVNVTTNNPPSNPSGQTGGTGSTTGGTGSTTGGTTGR